MVTMVRSRGFYLVMILAIVMITVYPVHAQEKGPTS